MQEADSRMERIGTIIWAVALVCVVVWAGVEYYKYQKWKNEDIGIAIYDLSWEDKKDGKVVYRKWRYFLNTRTNQPVGTEKFSKREPNDNYQLEETLIIRYPSDAEMKRVFEDSRLVKLEGN